MTGEDPAGTDNTISGGILYGPVLQGRDIQASFQLAAAAPVALAQLPAPVAGFSGRDDELAVLAGLLDPARATGPVVVSAVAGLAGVGKTTLAVAAGHAGLQRGWFSGVLFIDLHGYDEAPVQPGQALDALLRALGVAAEHIPPGTDERAALYRSVLVEISEPVLVIADNASSEAQVRPLLPGIGPHKVVVTSRHTLAGLGARLVDVTVLDQGAAVELLDEALRAARPDDDRITGDPQAAGQLARICGGLPLALQITAALLKADPTSPVSVLADDLAVENDRLERLTYDDGTGKLSVAAAFALSYRRLNHDQARMFRLLPVGLGADLSLPSAAVLADVSERKARGMLGDLGRAHLIEPALGAAGRWQMHDLMRLYALRLFDGDAEADGRELARDRLLGYYLGMAEAADKLVQTLPGMAVPEIFAGRDDALAWLDAERASLVTAVGMAADTGRDHAALQLPLALARYFAWRRRYDDLVATMTISLNAARHLGDRHGEGNVLSNLGAALAKVRRFEEAITAHEGAVAIFRETGNRHGEGMALGNIGLALADVRRFEEAIIAHKAAVAIFRETGGWHRFRKTGDRHSEGMALDNLANALQEAGRCDEAITAHNDAAAIFRKTGDRHSEGRAQTNLGMALQDAGRCNEAITAHQEAAAIFRETGDRHGEGGALDNLGSALQDAGRCNEAITAHQETAAIFRETGDRHGEGKALTNLGMALQDAGRCDEAITACQEALAIFRETGDRHGEGKALTNLGMALQEAGRCDEAITADQEAAAIFRETGNRHGEGVALTNLGNALQDAGRCDEAITAHEGAVAIFREAGNRHGEGMALGNLGPALADVRRFEEAITACQEALAIFRETGDRHGGGVALGNLGMVLQEAGRCDEAITAHEGAVTIFRETGDRHRTGAVLENLERARAAQQA